MKILASALAAWAAIVSCNEKNDSDLSFASESLGHYQDQSVYDIKLRPFAIKSGSGNSDRILDFKDRQFQMRFFRVIYQNNVPLDQPLEGDVVSFADIGGGLITADKLSDALIELTSAVPGRPKIPDGHYAAVICPISADATKDCLVDPKPLSAYKKKVQMGACGAIRPQNGSMPAETSLDESCKQLLFEGQNTFAAIAFPLTVTNDKFISGDKDLAYLVSSQGAGALIESQGTRGFALNGGKADCLETLEAGRSVCNPQPASGGAPIPKPPVPPRLPNRGPNDWDPFSRLPPFPPIQIPPLNSAPVIRVASSGKDCFVQGTKILGVKATQVSSLSQLSELEIQSIRQGDWVYNPLTNALYRVTVLSATTHAQGKNLYTLRTSSTSPGVIATGVHPILRANGLGTVADSFLNPQGQSGAGSLEDQILYAENQNLIYGNIQVSRRLATAPIKVYNVETDYRSAVRLNRNKMAGTERVCKTENDSFCLNFLGVIDGKNVIVAGDFKKQIEVNEGMSFYSDQAYKQALKSNP